MPPSVWSTLRRPKNAGTNTLARMPVMLDMVLSSYEWWFVRLLLLGECGDLVGAEAGPVIVGGDDDGGLHVAERLDGFERVFVGAEVDRLVVKSLGVESAECGIALTASAFSKVIDVGGCCGHGYRLICLGYLFVSC